MHSNMKLASLWTVKHNVVKVRTGMNWVGAERGVVVERAPDVGMLLVFNATVREMLFPSENHFLGCAYIVGAESNVILKRFPSSRFRGAQSECVPDAENVGHVVPVV